MVTRIEEAVGGQMHHDQKTSSGREDKTPMHYNFLVLLCKISVSGILLAVPMAILINTGSIG